MSARLPEVTFVHDSKGIKRSFCQICEDCTAFEWMPPGKDSSCTYCGCLPVRHKKVQHNDVSIPDNLETAEDIDLRDENENPENDFNSSLEEDETLKDVFPVPVSVYRTPLALKDMNIKKESSPIHKQGIILAHIPGSSRNYNSFNQANNNETQNIVQKENNQTTNTEDLRSLVPLAFPNQLEKFIRANVELSETQHAYIIRETAGILFRSRQFDPKRHEIEEMSVLLTNAYPFLRAPYGAGHIQTFDRMNACIKYLKRKYVHVSKEDSAVAAHNDICKKMQAEVSTHDNRASAKTLHDYLNQTRDIRKENARKMSATEMFIKYPALQRNDMLLWEFSKIVDLPFTTLQNNWSNAIPRILNGLDRSVPNELNNDGKSISILITVRQFFARVRSEKGQILEFLSEGTQLSNIVPSRDEPPRLKVITSTSSFNDLTLLCYADRKAIFSAHGCQATLLLLATYWVLNIAFPSDAKLQFSFVSFAVLRDAATNHVSKDVLKNVSLTKALKKCGLT